MTDKEVDSILKPFDQIDHKSQRLVVADLTRQALIMETALEEAVVHINRLLAVDPHAVRFRDAQQYLDLLAAKKKIPPGTKMYKERDRGKT